MKSHGSEPTAMSDGIQLFCFPHAGAGALAFREWQKALGAEIQVRPVEMPGRGARRNEPPVRSIESLIGILVAELASEMTPPYAVFGHSLGAVLAFEVLCKYLRSGGPEPVRIFVSAHRAPHLPPAARPLYHLPDRDLARELNRLGSAAAHLLENPELRRIFFPVLRADLELSDTYCTPPPQRAFTCPITALAPTEDLRVRPHEVRAWAEWTAGEFDCVMMRGGHFYLEDPRCGLWDLLRQRLCPNGTQAAFCAR